MSSTESQTPRHHLHDFARAWAQLCLTLHTLADLAPRAYQHPEVIKEALAQLADQADDLHVEWLRVDSRRE